VFRIFTYFAWVLLAVDAAFFASLIFSKGYSDAAGRGLMSGWGLVGLIPLAIGGAALYFGAQAHSWIGVVTALIVLGLPIVFFLSLYLS
jgi:hypothetical protein